MSLTDFNEEFWPRISGCAGNNAGSIFLRISFDFLSFRMRILIGLFVAMMMKNGCKVSATMSLLGKINSDPSILGKNHFENMNNDVSNSCFTTSWLLTPSPSRVSNQHSLEKYRSFACSYNSAGIPIYVQYSNDDQNGNVMSEIMMENYFNQYGQDPIFNRLVNNLKERYTDQGFPDRLLDTLCSEIATDQSVDPRYRSNIDSARFRHCFSWPYT